MKMTNEICPICGEGKLSVHVGKNHVEYNGQQAELDTVYSACDSCGSEQASAQQTRDNKRAMIAFRKKVDGLLTGKEIRAWRESVGLTQADAAKIFGGGPVAFSKYESDDVAQSDAMDRLLRVSLEIPEVLLNLATSVGVIIKHAAMKSSASEKMWEPDQLSLRSVNSVGLKVVTSSNYRTQKNGYGLAA